MIKSEVNYDCVIKSRFDLGRINRDTSGKGGVNPYPVQCINFNPNLDMNNIEKIYSKMVYHVMGIYLIHFG